MKTSIIISLIVMFLGLASYPIRACVTDGINEFMSQQGRVTVAGKRPQMLADFPQKAVIVQDECSDYEKEEVNGSAEEPDEELQGVEALLFESHSLNHKGNRKFKSTLPGHFRILLEVCCANEGKGPRELGRLYNAAIQQAGFADTKKVNGMRDLFGKTFANQGLIIASEGKLEQVTDKGRRVLQFLKDEEAAGNVQPAKMTNKAALKAKVPAANEANKQKEMLRPEIYVELLGAMDLRERRTSQQIQKLLHVKAKGHPSLQATVKSTISHFKSYLATCLRNAWITQVPCTEAYILTQAGVERRQKFNQVVIAKTVPMVFPGQPEEALPHVNVALLQNPLMYFLVLEAGQKNPHFMKAQEYCQQICDLYSEYTGEELTSSFHSLSQRYLSPLAQDYKWLEQEKEPRGFKYKVRLQAIDTYLEPLRERAQDKFKPSQRQREKQMREGAENDMEEIVVAGDERQGSQKRHKA